MNSPPRRARGGQRYVLLALLLAIAGLSLWTWLTLSWAYSEGTRAGLLQKFSHRGWLCKTQEGDLVLAQYPVAGVAPQIWQFSVRDPAVSAQLERLVGAGVRLHYTEHPGVPSTCFADTRYFVDRVTLMEQSPMGNGVPANGAPGDGAPGDGAPGDGAPGTGASGIGASGNGTPGNGANGKPRPLSPGPPPTVPPAAAPVNP